MSHTHNVILQDTHSQFLRMHLTWDKTLYAALRATPSLRSLGLLRSGFKSGYWDGQIGWNTPIGRTSSSRCLVSKLDDSDRQIKPLTSISI